MSGLAARLPARPSAGARETQSDSHVPTQFPGPFPRNSHSMRPLEPRAPRRWSSAISRHPPRSRGESISVNTGPRNQGVRGVSDQVACPFVLSAPILVPRPPRSSGDCSHFAPTRRWANAHRLEPARRRGYRLTEHQLLKLLCVRLVKLGAFLGRPAKETVTDLAASGPRPKRYQPLFSRYPARYPVRYS